MPRKLTRAITAALLAGLASITPAGAQADQTHPATPRRVPVTLVLRDALPAGADAFAILRRAGGEPGDVIVLRRNADSTALSAAIEQLTLVRRVQGDTASASSIVRTRPKGGAARAPRLLPWARRVVDDLHRAPRRMVAGIGMVPAVVIWLPPQRGRRAQP